MDGFLARHPSLRYVLPFATFMVLLVVGPMLHLPPRVEWSLRPLLVGIVLLWAARPLLRFRLTRPAATTAIGVVVFVLWIAPDQIFPGWRDGILFQNAVTGRVASTMSVESRTDGVVIALRAARAIVIVPIVEELFWRGWLPRWIDRVEDFARVPFGSYTSLSFGATALLFGVEHGPFWDVGIVAGVIYNWWMIKTKNLGDLVWCHAVTNGCLAGWVLLTGQWQYW